MNGLIPIDIKIKKYNKFSSLPPNNTEVLGSTCQPLIVSLQISEAVHSAAYVFFASEI
jgi:hypothetical protein